MTYTTAALFRKREVYENDENSHEKFKSIEIISVSNSDFLGQRMNRSLATNVV
jgi:hypothetical protein